MILIYEKTQTILPIDVWPLSPTTLSTLNPISHRNGILDNFNNLSIKNTIFYDRYEDFLMGLSIFVD